VALSIAKNLLCRWYQKVWVWIIDWRELSVWERETCCSPYRAFTLSLILLTWRIWWAANNASKWQMGFNLAFRGLSTSEKNHAKKIKHNTRLCRLPQRCRWKLRSSGLLRCEWW